MRVGATDESLALVAAVAAGAAEALDLDLEPSISLRTIVVEAAGNVITHAYPDHRAGPLEVEISGDLNGGQSLSGVTTHPVHIAVRDEGIGCGLPPSAADPPGLGLSIICSLSDAMTLRNDLEGGTSLDATIIPDRSRDDAEPAGHPPGPESCELSFGDEAYLRPILARVLAAQVDASGVTVDELGEAVRAGDAIADGISGALSSGPLPPMTLTPRANPPGVSVGVGPVAEREGLAEELRASLADRAPNVSVGHGIGSDAAMTMLTIPLAHQSH